MDRAALTLEIAALVAALSPADLAGLASLLALPGGADELAQWLRVLARLDPARRAALLQRLRYDGGPQL